MMLKYILKMAKSNAVVIEKILRDINVDCKVKLVFI